MDGDNAHQSYGREQPERAEVTRWDDPFYKILPLGEVLLVRH